MSVSITELQNPNQAQSEAERKKNVEYNEMKHYIYVSAGLFNCFKIQNLKKLWKLHSRCKF